MKSKMLVLMVLSGLLLITTGCIGPLYTNEGQYSRGKGKGLFGSWAGAAAQQDRMALDKLRASTPQVLVTNGVVQGYKGLVANLSQWTRYNFKVVGPEVKSYLLGPGERVVDYLVPGQYTCFFYQGGAEVGQWTFHVGVQQSTFMNETYHWYVYTDR